MLLWLSSVCWVRTLDTPKWDILATDVAVYFDSKLRKLKLQTYQSISPAKMREKPPENAKKEGKLGVEGGKIPFTCRECCRNGKVYHIYHNLYPGWQKLPQPSTGSSYVTSYIKSFILENKFPLYLEYCCNCREHLWKAFLPSFRICTALSTRKWEDGRFSIFLGRRHNSCWTHSPQTRSCNKTTVFWSYFREFVGAQKIEDLSEIQFFFCRSISNKK